LLSLQSTQRDQRFTVAERTEIALRRDHARVLEHRRDIDGAK